MDNTTHVIVVGAGFAGMRVVRGLRNNSRVKVTLISEDNTFRYSPVLYRTATGHRFRESAIAISDLVNGFKNVEFIKAKAKTIDKAKHTITTEDGKTYNYDYAVLA